jgi:hypothetical protein
MIYKNDEMCGLDKSINVAAAARSTEKCVRQITGPDGKFTDAAVQARFEAWLSAGGWSKYAKSGGAS